MMARPAVVKYGVRGYVGDHERIGRHALGTEVVLVVRCTVKTLSERLDDGVTVCDASLAVVHAALVADDIPALTQLLDNAAAMDGKLAL